MKRKKTLFFAAYNEIKTTLSQFETFAKLEKMSPTQYFMSNNIRNLIPVCAAKITVDAQLYS